MYNFKKKRQIKET